MGSSSLGEVYIFAKNYYVMFAARSKPSCHRVATLAWPDLHRRRDENEQPFALRKCSLLTTEPVDFHRGRSYAPIADTLPVAGGTSGLPKEPTAFLSYPNQLGGQLQWCSGGAARLPVRLPGVRKVVVAVTVGTLSPRSLTVTLFSVARWRLELEPPYTVQFTVMT